MTSRVLVHLSSKIMLISENTEKRYKMYSGDRWCYLCSLRRPPRRSSIRPSNDSADPSRSPLLRPSISKSPLAAPLMLNPRTGSLSLSAGKMPLAPGFWGSDGGSVVFPVAETESFRWLGDPPEASNLLNNDGWCPSSSLSSLNRDLFGDLDCLPSLGPLPSVPCPRSNLSGRRCSEVVGSDPR